MAEKMRKALYDRESDSLYIVISKGPEEGFIELAPDINLELGKNGKVIGIEILKASRMLRKIVPSRRPLRIRSLKPSEKRTAEALTMIRDGHWAVCLAARFAGLR